MADRQDRRLILEEQIRRRLESICSNFEKKDFEKLVEQIADNSIKGDIRPFRPNDSSMGDRPGKL